ncbi:MAG: hypothetical protein QE484_16315 [Rhizobium sp.]|nr:hypothetical protein [Rhizobium sp.]
MIVWTNAICFPLSGCIPSALVLNPASIASLKNALKSFWSSSDAIAVEIAVKISPDCTLKTEEFIKLLTLFWVSPFSKVSAAVLLKDETETMETPGPCA